MNEEVCGMMGDETVYGPAVVGGSQVVFKKGEKQLAKTKWTETKAVAAK